MSALTIGFFSMWEAFALDTGVVVGCIKCRERFWPPGLHMRIRLPTVIPRRKGIYFFPHKRSLSADQVRWAQSLSPNF
jgi:hypothetical protein